MARKTGQTLKGRQRVIVCLDCGREATQSDDHVFEGANWIEWWCEDCDKIIERVAVDPVPYVPVVFF